MSIQDDFKKAAESVLDNWEFQKACSQYERRPYWKKQIAILDSTLKSNMRANPRWNFDTRKPQGSWGPYLSSLDFDDGISKQGIVIRHCAESWTGPNWNGEKTCVGHYIDLVPAIELLINPDGSLYAPAGMDGNDRMVMEFPDLDDFISYLNEEMAKGNYPRHLSSDWK